VNEVDPVLQSNGIVIGMMDLIVVVCEKLSGKETALIPSPLDSILEVFGSGKGSGILGIIAPIAIGNPSEENIVPRNGHILVVLSIDVQNPQQGQSRGEIHLIAGLDVGKTGPEGFAAMRYEHPGHIS